MSDIPYSASTCGALHRQGRLDGGYDLYCDDGHHHGHGVQIDRGELDIGIIREPSSAQNNLQVFAEQFEGLVDFNARLRAPAPRASYTTERVTFLEMKVQALKELIIALLVADPIDHEGLDTCTHCAGVPDEHDDDCAWLAASEAAKAF